MSMIFYSTHHHYFQTETNTFKGPTFVMTEVDGRAWWAAVYGVEQSRTRLKRLSRSSSSLLEFKVDFSMFHWVLFVDTHLKS